MRLVLLCGQCTRWQTAGRPGRYTDTWHRDKAHGLAEISSTCACSVLEISSFSLPTACRRSTRVFNQHADMFNFSA